MTIFKQITCKNKKNNGFTLLELMIVMALMGIIILVGFPNFQSLRQDQTLYSEASKIKSDLRYMQQIAFDTQNTYVMTYGANSYTLELSSSPNTLLKSENLEGNVKFQESGTLRIGGDGIPAGDSFPVIITLVKNNLTVNINIFSGGKIEIL